MGPGITKGRTNMAAIKRHASAAWHGSGKEGGGTLTTQSGTLKNTPYSFKMRFGDEPGTNPEELIAAAHAGCFSMALAFKLGGAGHTAETIATEARLTMEQEGAGFRIAAIHLVLRAKVPGLDKAAFADIARQAKEDCPVSRVLNAAITLDATLE